MCLSTFTVMQWKVLQIFGVKYVTFGVFCNPHNWTSWKSLALYLSFMLASIMLKCRMHPPKGLPGVPAAQIIITPILYLQFLYVIYIICTPSQYNNHKYKNSDVKIISACIQNFVDWVFLVCSLMSFVGNWFNFLGVCVCCCFVCLQGG